MEALLWISIAIVFYTFFGYGLVISLLAYMKKPKVLPQLADEDLPEVTLLVAAYNEEEIIRQKIHNCLKLDYPKDKLNIAFVTDGSTDFTNQIIQEFPNLHLYSRAERAGKIAAVNRVMPKIDTPITVFSDANVMINPAGIRELVKHFQRNLVAAVSGEKKVLQKKKDGASASGEGFYWRYESFLKRKDAEWNSLVGSAGELFAIRTHLYTQVDKNTLIEDFVITMQLAADGYKVAYEPNATATETASANIREEAKRKVRISAGGIQAVLKLTRLLNIFRYGKLSFQYISHRALRWTLMPLALISILVTSFVLCTESWYCDALFKAQLVFYGMAILGHLLERKEIKLKLLYVPYYFTFMHVCVVRGWFRYFSGNQKVTWEKAQRVVSFRV